MRRIFLLCLLMQVRLLCSGAEYNILSYGAVADGIKLNTTAIQSAIDAAFQAGGGRVIVPAGRFLTGSIVLKTRVELHLLKNAVLLGSTDPSHYTKLNRWLALVMADNQQHISITGDGEIDGQGRSLALHIDSLFYAGKIDSADYNFVEMRPIHYIRPQLIEMVRCSYIRVQQVTLRNAACWVQTYDQCSYLIIDSVRVESDAYWNNDGMDIQDSRNVRITNCYVNAADDGICLKSQNVALGCDSVYIGHCTVRSSASAIKFGTVSHGGFRRVLIEDIRVYDTYRSAIAIECVDGGTIEDIVVDHVEAVNTGNAFFIRLGKRNKNGDVGTLKKVTLKNITVQVPFGRPDEAYELRGPDLPFFHNTFPASIVGIPGHPVQQVILENIQIRYPGRGNNGLANMPLSRLDAVPEKEAAYPEFSMFGELPAWGLYVRHTDGLIMKNVQLSVDAPDYRPGVVFDDVDHLDLQSMRLDGDTKPIILHNTEKARINKNLVTRKI